MQSPTGPGPYGGRDGDASMHTMLSVPRTINPKYAYVARKPRQAKPYGPSFITTMNRTWRGPGEKYLVYALVAFCASLVFLTCAGVYIGHRNVGRMIVRRTEIFGAIFIMLFVGCWGLTFHYIYKARMASNRWRQYVRYRPEGLRTAVAVNQVYSPEDSTKLVSNTFTSKGLTQMPTNRRRRRRSMRATYSGRTTPGGPSLGVSGASGADYSRTEKVHPVGAAPPPSHVMPRPRPSYPPQGHYPPGPPRHPYAPQMAHGPPPQQGQYAPYPRIPPPPQHARQHPGAVYRYPPPPGHAYPPPLPKGQAYPPQHSHGNPPRAAYQPAGPAPWHAPPPQAFFPEDRR